MTDRASDVVARRVRYYRGERGWTAQQLAALCAKTGAPELTAAVIANIETGRRSETGKRRRNVTIDEVMTLTAVLRVPITSLVDIGAEIAGAPTGAGGILDSQSVIQRLRAIRDAKRISAQRLADMTGIARSIIANLENGRRGSITLDEARSISDALGVDLRVALSDEPMHITRKV